RRGAKNFSAEASNIEARGGHGHHFDGAAGEAEAEGPDGTLAGPVHGFVKLREDDAFVLEELAEIIGLGESDVLGDGGFHDCSEVFSHSGREETNGMGESESKRVKG